MIQTRVISDAAAWDELVATNDGHPLQLWGWGEVKAAGNWRANRIAVYEDDKLLGAAQVLIRNLPMPFTALAYVPRGPIVAVQGRETDILSALVEHARSLGAVSLRIEPDEKEFSVPGKWRKVGNTILLPHTATVDLTRSEDDILSDIAGKRRYDIRKSSKNAEFKEVSREQIDAVLAVYHHTASRAGFALHDDAYYTAIADELGEHSRIVGAFTAEGELLAFTWLAATPRVAFELYSGITDEGQRLRVNYGLKWWAITTMKRDGVKTYDFNGLLNDGISDFKRAFIKEDTHLAGSFEYPLSIWYPLWQHGLPTMKRVAQSLRRLLGKQ